MKNIPERIYLQIDDDELPEDFNQLEVTWCSDRINENDIAYVREPSSPTVKESETGEQEIASDYVIREFELLRMNGSTEKQAMKRISETYKFYLNY